MQLYQEFTPKIRSYFRIFIFILVIGLALSSLTFGFRQIVLGWSTIGDEVSPRQITVSGEGKVAIRPDLAVFFAGVLTDAKKIRDAQQQNNEHSQKMIIFLGGKGVEEKDIKTIGYSIYPQYQYYEVPPCYASSCPPRRPPEILSYQVRHTIEVKVRDLDKLDELLDGVVEAGANEVGSVNFTVENEEEVRVEARKKAIEDAKKKAKMLSKDLGVRIRRVVNFSESGNIVPFFQKGLEYGIGGDGLGGGTTPSVQPGEQEIRSNVVITYEFR